MENAMTNDYQDVDFVALGITSDPEQSRRLNAVRRAGHTVAAQMREISEEFAQLPAPFQPIVASLIMVGAEPSNFVVNTASDGGLRLFGTVLAPDKQSWRVFQATVAGVDASDATVQIQNLGADSAAGDGEVFDTIEDAIDVLTQISMSAAMDCDLFDRIEAGKWIN